jgi:predicted secreted protein
MATYAGQGGALHFNTAVGQSSGTNVTEITNWSLSSEANAIETSAMGDTFRSFTTGLKSWEGTADIVWTDSADSGSVDTIFQIGDTGTIFCYPLASDTDMKLSGDVIITGIEYVQDLEDVMRASVSFQGTGTLTVDNNLA